MSPVNLQNIIVLVLVLESINELVLLLSSSIRMSGVHVQLCPQTGFRYFATFIDDYSRTTWLYLMKNYSELLSHISAFYVEITTQFHTYVQNLRSDNTKEYRSGLIFSLPLG